MNMQANKPRLGRFLILILGVVFLGVGGGLLAGSLTGKNMAGPVILFSFTLACSSLLFWSRKNWWALIPTGLFLGGGVAATLDILYPYGRAAGPIYLFLLSGTFLAIVLLSRRNWWALIPGGFFASLGVVATLENYLPQRNEMFQPHTHILGVYFWVLLLGLAATFGVLWLMRKTRSTGWAGYPAVMFLAASLLVFLLGDHFFILLR